ncbi:MAG: hypothetical protein LBJ72_02155 [Dysgonamonadaceae bacterium]|nr:hypothetical protein [Dysgonamonadaceae bacterium]
MMSSKKIFFVILLFSIVTKLSAQEYLAYNNSANKEAKVWEFLSAIPSVIDKSIVEKSGKHDFGQRVACLKTLMEKYYITKEDVIPGDPMMRTIVLKPNVYYTVRKIEKYLKKEVKKGDMTAKEASSEMEHVLEVALSVIDTEETDSFETTLNKNKKNVEDQISLFQQVTLQNIYP